MRLLLVYPENPQIGDKNRSVTRRFPAIGLPIIANLTPAEWHTTLLDEEQGDTIDFDDPYDLVGISSMTSQARRAYAIGDEFRRRGVPVVHGGSHPSVMPHEALTHGDAVVVGEGERSWPSILRDFSSNGRLAGIYSHAPERDNWYVAPRRSLVKTGRSYPITPVVATRGCPFSCSFCSVSSVFGRGYRHRTVEDVVSELRALREEGHRTFIFIDDNIMGAPEWSKQLFRAMEPLGIHWAGQSHLAAARDPELMRLAQRSGLIALFVGVESINRESLAGARKGVNNVDRYADWVKVFHEHGVVIFAGLIFGFDEDDPSVFARTVEAVDKLDIAVANFSMLMPLPGTDLRATLEKQGRILDDNWEHYDGTRVVYRPALMTPDQLAEGYEWACRSYYTPMRILGRFGSNWRHPILYFTFALSYMHKERAMHGNGTTADLAFAQR